MAMPLRPMHCLIRTGKRKRSRGSSDGSVSEASPLQIRMRERTRTPMWRSTRRTGRWRSWRRQGASARLVAGVFAVCIFLGSSVCAQTETSASRSNATEKIIIDTDIGGDIDDAFAVGLALQSPEFKILGISSAWGDTHLRARLLSRLLKETGRGDIPVAMGIAKHPPGKVSVLTQAPYAQGGPADQNYPNAVDFILEQ